MNATAGYQGDYVDITDDITGAGVYSMAKAAPGVNVQGGTLQPDTEYFVLEKVDLDPAAGDYNRLIRDDATHMRKCAHGTDNRQRNEENCYQLESTGSGPAAEYFFLEKSNTVYNKLGDSVVATTSDAINTYHRLGDTATDIYNKLGEKPSVENALDSTYSRLREATA